MTSNLKDGKSAGHDDIKILPKYGDLSGVNKLSIIKYCMQDNKQDDFE